MTAASLVSTSVFATDNMIIVRPPNWGVTLFTNAGKQYDYLAEIIYFECGEVIGLVRVPEINVVAPLAMLRLGPVAVNDALMWMDELPYR
jgi:hypothetical protein